MQFADTAKLPAPDPSNVAVLRQCVSIAGKAHNVLNGPGADTWGDSRKPPERKTLIKLFWGLFTGVFISPANKLEGSPFSFKEHLVAIRPSESGHTLMNWAMLRFVPFCDELQMYYPMPFYDEKYLLPLRPVWITLIIVFLILQSLRKFFSMLWQVMIPLSWSMRKVVGDLEKGNSYDPPNYLSSSRSTNISIAVDSNANTSHSYYTEMNEKSIIVKFSGTWVVRLISSASKTVAASLLPIVAISVLAKVHGINLILGLIAAFTAAFAAGLVFLSPRSSRLEIFAATAGYVLFIVSIPAN